MLYWQMTNKLFHTRAHTNTHKSCSSQMKWWTYVSISHLIQAQTLTNYEGNYFTSCASFKVAGLRGRIWEPCCKSAASVISQSELQICFFFSFFFSSHSHPPSSLPCKYTTNHLCWLAEIRHQLLVIRPAACRLDSPHSKEPISSSLQQSMTPRSPLVPAPSLLSADHHHLTCCLHVRWTQLWWPTCVCASL